MGVVVLVDTDGELMNFSYESKPYSLLCTPRGGQNFTDPENLLPQLPFDRRGKFLFCRCLRRIGGVQNIPPACLRRTFRRSDGCWKTQRGSSFWRWSFPALGKLEILQESLAFVVG